MSDKPRRRGHPSLFDDPTVREKVIELAAEGKTDQQIADLIGVSRRTLQLWKTKDWEFLLSLKRAKSIADDVVEASLFRRATGYSHKAVKFLQHEGVVMKEEYIEHYPPDTTAAIFWLKNRRPKKWRDKQHVEVEEKGFAERLEAARKRLREKKDAKE